MGAEIDLPGPSNDGAMFLAPPNLNFPRVSGRIPNELRPPLRRGEPNDSGPQENNVSEKK